MCVLIGKSSAVEIIVKECSLESVEFNASNTRTRSLLKDHVAHMTTNCSLKKTKTVLVMDEVDGMSSSGDFGGMAELIQIISKSKIPVICICNDRSRFVIGWAGLFLIRSSSPKVKTLASKCVDLRFAPPTIQETFPRLTHITKEEGFRSDRIALETLLRSTKCDIRQTLNTLQMLRVTTDSLQIPKEYIEG